MLILGSRIRTNQTDLLSSETFQRSLVHMHEFWYEFIRDLEKKIEKKEGYKTQVFNILNEYNKDKDRSHNELMELQIQIENLTMKFDEKNIFKESYNIIKILIGKDLICAKEYLYRNIPRDLYNKTIEPFGEYTLEAIIIYVLGSLYNSIQESAVVRLSTLIEKLDTTVRTQADIIKKMSRKEQDRTQDDIIKENKSYKYEIGKLLVEFMKERDLIQIDIITSDHIVKKKNKNSSEKNLFVVCNFELRLLPLKLNLPMVCKPVEWNITTPRMKEKPLMLSDMRGGYLSEPTLNIYNRFKLLSSRNISHFNIELHDSKLEEMCFILNGLQKQGF